MSAPAMPYPSDSPSLVMKKPQHCPGQDGPRQVFLRCRPLRGKIETQTVVFIEMRNGSVCARLKLWIGHKHPRAFPVPVCHAHGVDCAQWRRLNCAFPHVASSALHHAKGRPRDQESRGLLRWTKPSLIWGTTCHHKRYSVEQERSLNQGQATSPSWIA